MTNTNAVTELLKSTQPQELSENITEFWECWLTHEDTNTAPAEERADKLWFYKSMVKFFETLEE